MTAAIFPAMPGLKWGTVKSPMWSTGIQKAASGRELRAAFYSFPRYKISLGYEVLRSGALAELQAMVGFFNARKGSFESFLYLDPEDNAVVDQSFGVGAAGQTQFQLVRTYGGYVEPVLAPQLVAHGGTAPVVKVNGVVQTTGVDVAADGLVTFATAPAAGAALSWSGIYYWRCRFMQDSADFDRFLYQLWALKKIELITLKDKE
jgi:uncharacterized protein (TIGR02217 family)